MLRVGFDAEALAEDLGLELLWEAIAEAPGERILGALQPEARLLILNEGRLDELEASAGLRRFTIGHEIGHWMLHAGDARAGTLPISATGRTWCRSGAQEPPERQAEMFAGSLLVPEDQLRQRLRVDRRGGWSEVYELAEIFVVTPTAMLVRLEELGFYHTTDSGVPALGRARQAGQSTLFG